MSRYLHGAAALAARPHQDRRDVVGYNWWQVLYSPANLAYDYSNNPATVNYSPGSTQNPYWSQQVTTGKTSPFAAATTARLQSGAQLQATLRAQQAANLAALRAQLATMAPPSSAPTTGYPPPDTATFDSSATIPTDTTPSDGSVVGAAPEQIAVIRIKNLPEVIKNQGGALGRTAFALLPDLVAAKAYSTFADELKSKMQEKGVDVDVSMVTAPPTGGGPSSVAGELLKTAAVGAGAIGVGWATWHFLLRRLILGKTLMLHKKRKSRSRR